MRENDKKHSDFNEQNVTILLAWKAVPSQMVKFVLLRSGMPIMLPSRQDCTLKQVPAKRDHGQLDTITSASGCRLIWVISTSR